VLVLETPVHPPLPDRERATGPRLHLAVERLLVLQEADSRPAAGVLDPLGLSRERSQHLPHHLVDVARPAAVDLGRDLEEQRRHLAQARAGAL
jgi:hypothetical protein